MMRDVRLWQRFAGKARYDGAVPEEALRHEPPAKEKEPPRWRCVEHGLVEAPLFVGNVPYCYWLTCDRQLEDLRPPARATRPKGTRLRVVQGGRPRARRTVPAAPQPEPAPPIQAASSASSEGSDRVGQLEPIVVRTATATTRRRCDVCGVVIPPATAFVLVEGDDVAARICIECACTTQDPEIVSAGNRAAAVVLDRERRSA